jgi:hypothetical protein
MLIPFLKTPCSFGSFGCRLCSHRWRALGVHVFDGLDDREITRAAAEVAAKLAANSLAIKFGNP